MCNNGSQTSNFKYPPAIFWQTIFVFTFIVNLTILAWSISRWAELKVILWRSVWIIPLGLYLLILAGCMFLFWRIQKDGADRLVAALELERFSGPIWRIAGAACFAVILWAIPWLKFTFHVGETIKKSTQDPVLTMIVFYWAVWWLVLLAAAALKVAFKTSWPGGFAAALVFLGIAYEIFIRAQAVSSYPFSLGWSESSRFYYGSLYFAQSVYGAQVPLSTLHPSRYLLQSLPFLIPGLDLVANRLWQVLLWIGLAGGAAVALVRPPLPLPFSPKRGGVKGEAWLLAGWLFLFLLRVGVYYHLEPMVILLLLFVSAKRPWRSLAAVAISSAWAGISRVNWFPVPAMLATAIYLLEEPIIFSPLPKGEGLGRRTEPVEVVRAIFNYLKQPIIWVVVGLLSALAAEAIYIPLSGNANNIAAFSSSFSSDLLWDRLWPNDTFPLGVLLGILIVSGPLLVVVLTSLTPSPLPLGKEQRAEGLHPIRRLGLLSMLAILFTGGLVVSVKIGGGGDLHNMDAYAVLVSLIAVYLIGGKVGWESTSLSSAENRHRRKWGERGEQWPVVAVALLIPLVFLIPALSPFPQFNAKSNRVALLQLKTLAEQAGHKGPVLFINERHLVTFGQVNVDLVPKYEAVTMMEMAMSNNQPYLQQFYTDLKDHRFAAIVAGKQNVGVKEEGSFAEESNVWNTRVSPYILCYYESTAEIEADESKIEFYVPRAEAGVCE